MTQRRTGLRLAIAASLLGGAPLAAQPAPQQPSDAARGISESAGTGTFSRAAQSGVP